MKTQFSLQQLAENGLRDANDILRRCVHCGFCNATCPTFKLTGDERDGPRGRIYLMKEYLESDAGNEKVTRRHVDRCLTCLSCTTTCPSGVDYAGLLEIVRPRLEQSRGISFTKTWRWIFGQVLTRSWVFRAAVGLGRLTKPVSGLLPRTANQLLSQIPAIAPRSTEFDRPQVFKAKDGIRYRVALLPGCVQKTVNPEINRAAIRLLTRHGCEVVLPKSTPCCGALNQHLGQQDRARSLALANVKALSAAMKKGRLEAILSTASGCGTTLKDYGDILKDDSDWSEEASDVAAKMMDISEFLLRLKLDVTGDVPAIRIAYQAPCSLHHGQGVVDANQKLLSRCGFDVVEPEDPHICCGSAGVYSFLQPKLSDTLGREKSKNLDVFQASAVASANVGCMAHLKPRLETPIFHTVQLLDWATGGPKPTV